MDYARLIAWTFAYVAVCSSMASAIECLRHFGPHPHTAMIDTHARTVASVQGQGGADVCAHQHANAHRCGSSKLVSTCAMALRCMSHPLTFYYRQLPPNKPF